MAKHSRCVASRKILPDGTRLVMAVDTGERFDAGTYHPPCPDCPVELFTVARLVEQNKRVRDEDRKKLLVK